MKFTFEYEFKKALDSFENKNYIKCYEACKFVFNSYCLKKVKKQLKFSNI